MKQVMGKIIKCSSYNQSYYLKIEKKYVYVWEWDPLDIDLNWIRKFTWQTYLQIKSVSYTLEYKQ